MNQEELLKEIKKYIDTIGITGSHLITLETPIGEEAINDIEGLGLDSLDIMALVMHLEELTDIKCSNFSEVKIIRDIIEHFKI